jgi:hypothetical protein
LLGNVRELSHVMERVTLLHMGEEVDAKTLMQLCQPLMPPQVSPQAASSPPEVAGVRALPAEAEQIRQALVQSGAMWQAARCWHERDAVRYRMRRYGIVRATTGATSAPVSPRARVACWRLLPSASGASYRTARSLHSTSRSGGVEIATGVGRTATCRARRNDRALRPNHRAGLGIQTRGRAGPGADVASHLRSRVPPL